MALPGHRPSPDDGVMSLGLSQLSPDDGVMSLGLSQLSPDDGVILPVSIVS